MSVKITVNNIDVNKISKAEEYVNECIKQRSFVIQDFNMSQIKNRHDALVYRVREYIAKLGTSHNDNFDEYFVKFELALIRWAIRTLEKTQCENCIISDVRTVCFMYGYDKFDEDFKEYYEDNNDNKIESSRVSVMNQIIFTANEKILSKIKKMFP